MSNQTPTTNSIEAFEYELPFELIAQEPLQDRSSSRLLHLHRASGAIQHRHFADIEELLNPGDVLVLNNTKVLPARLVAHRHSGGTVKILLLKTKGAANIWEALVTPIKRLKPGETLSVTAANGDEYVITVKEITVGFDGYKRLVVDLGDPAKVWELLNGAGFAPLPPYIQRRHDGESTPTDRTSDLSRYQTVFARQPGAVAAPTAGLHFTEDLLQRLQAKGVEIVYVTLHVGAGTFKPITDGVEEHKIEPEHFQITEEAATALNKAKSEGRKIIAVGTTSMRTLETAGASGHIDATEDGVTNLYVKPGHEFQFVSGMVTNFHLSKSSLLVLVSAFAGRENIMNAYNIAVENRYRFYSYGDAMLIL